MQADFADIGWKAGPPSNVAPAPAAVIETYRGRVPDGLLEFWSEIGWCSFQNGYVWVPDPHLFDGLLAEVFRGDPEFDPPHFVIFMYDAFGKLYGWSSDTKIVTLDIAAYNPNFSPMSAEVRQQTGDVWSDDRYVANSIALAKKERDYFADNDLSDFERALVTLGPLSPGEIYGYNPSFALGGSGAPETLIKAPIVEHLLMLSQLVRIGVERYVLDPTDTSNPMGRRERVRELGPARE